MSTMKSAKQGFHKTIVKLIAAAALALTVVCAGRIRAAYAGDIFTRSSTKLSYPSTRTIALKTPVIGTEVRYFSSDKDVAYVGKDGEIMTVGVGTCTITAIGEDGTVDECVVTVEEPDAPHKQIALTFDDGPDYFGQELLDFLAERDVKVTFFYIGNQIEKYSDNVYRAYNEGHEIGNHSWSHPVLSTMKNEGIMEQLDSTSEAIYNVTGAYPTVFRPPYGSKNDRLLSICGFPCILWSVDTLDWKYRDVDYVTEQIVGGASDGAVILVHEIHKTTIAAAKIAIDRLLDAGWEFVTITELMERDGSKLQDGAVYSKKKKPE